MKKKQKRGFEYGKLVKLIPTRKKKKTRKNPRLYILPFIMINIFVMFSKASVNTKTKQTNRKTSQTGSPTKMANRRFIFFFFSFKANY